MASPSSAQLTENATKAKVKRGQEVPPSDRPRTRKDVVFTSVDQCASNTGFTTRAPFYAWLNSDLFKPFYLEYDAARKADTKITRAKVSKHFGRVDGIPGKAKEYVCSLLFKGGLNANNSPVSSPLTTEASSNSRSKMTGRIMILLFQRCSASITPIAVMPPVLANLGPLQKTSRMSGGIEYGVR